MYGKDFDYASSRLVDSIVRLEKTGEPVHIKTVNVASGVASVVKLRDSTESQAHIDDLNLKPIPLGWCNTGAGATYLCRIPRRQDWKQGIRTQTCFSSKISFARVPRKDIDLCVRGIYPKFSDLISKPWNRITAWSRKWASDGANLYYGNLGRVGSVTKQTGPILDKEFTYLTESLGKSLS